MQDRCALGPVGSACRVGGVTLIVALLRTAPQRVPPRRAVSNRPARAAPQPTRHPRTRGSSARRSRLPPSALAR
eukprot:3501380-Prymnesium_polylepis.1